MKINNLAFIITHRAKVSIKNLYGLVFIS